MCRFPLFIALYDQNLLTNTDRQTDGQTDAMLVAFHKRNIWHVALKIDTGNYNGFLGKYTHAKWPFGKK